MALRNGIKDIGPADVRAIGARYQLKLTGFADTTAERLLVFAGFQVVFLGLSKLITNRIAEMLVGATNGGLFFLAGWALLAALTVPLFFVNVPKITGLVVTSYFGGWLHVFGPGLHIKYPWEHYSKSSIQSGSKAKHGAPDHEIHELEPETGLEDFYELRAIVVEGTSRFVVQGEPREAGTGGRGAIGVTFNWTVQYTPVLQLLPLHVRTELHAIAEGLKEVVENAISETMLGKSITQILDRGTVDEIQKTLANAFRGLDKDGNPAEDLLDEAGSTLEERYGFMIELSTLGPPNFDEDYNEALRAQVISGMITEEAAFMADKLGISGEKALDTKLILNKENVTKNIVTIQADDALRDVAENMGHVLRAGSDIARAVNKVKPGGHGGEGHDAHPPEHGEH